MSLPIEIEKFLLEEGYSVEEVAQLEMCECGEWVAMFPELFSTLSYFKIIITL